MTGKNSMYSDFERAVSYILLRIALSVSQIQGYMYV